MRIVRALAPLTWVLCALAALVFSKILDYKDRPITIAVTRGVEGQRLHDAAENYPEASIRVEEFSREELYRKELWDVRQDHPEYDVIQLDDPWLPSLAQHGQLRQLRLSGKDEKDFVESCRNVARADCPNGCYYAIPYAGNSSLFCINRRLYPEGRPATWPAAIEKAEEIRKGGKAEYSYVLRAFNNNALVADFPPVLWSFDSGSLSEKPTPGKALGAGAEPAIKALTKLESLSPPAWRSFEDFDIGGFLLHGKAAMGVVWAAWAMQMYTVEADVPGGVDLDFVQVPGDRPLLGAWLLAVPAKAKKAEEAVKFVNWATSSEELRVAAKGGNAPPRFSVFADQELQRQFPSFPEQLTSLKNARPRPRSSVWLGIEEIVGKGLRDVDSGRIDPAAAVARINRDIDCSACHR